MERLARPRDEAAEVRRVPWIPIALVAIAVLLCWRIRVWTAHSVPIWDGASPVGLLKSDPALLYWFTERIERNGGSIPDDFAATTAVNWPDAVDARVEFPQLQMWLAANLHRGLAGGTPLHEFCVTLFSLLAALTIVPAFGLALELTRRPWLAALAAALFFLLPANWRTSTFVLLGEDVALPCLAAHFWLLARAARLRTAASFILAGIPLALSMAAWHATGFFVAIEAGAFFAWYLRSGKNPFAAPRAWLVLAPFALACLVEPMLRGKWQILSLPMQIALALIALAAVERRRPLRLAARVGAGVAAVGAFAGIAALVSAWKGGGLGDYSHVFGLIAAKLRTFGVRPGDPTTIPFEVRILWQGPFDTLDRSAMVANLSSSLLGAAALAAVALPAWIRGRDERSRGAGPMLAIACAVGLLASWLILRTLVFTGILFPIASVLVLASVRDRTALAIAAIVLLGPPAWRFPEFSRFQRTHNEWYSAEQFQEIRAVVAAIREHVPEGEPIACDEINGTAILAHTGHPILVQPKYESRRARERLEEFRMAAIRGSAAELAEVLRRNRCRYLVYDWPQLWTTRYQAGLGEYPKLPIEGSAMWTTWKEPASLAGFRLLWRSPLPSDRTRIYVLDEPGS